ncbi:MAG: hypothetical protein KF825_06690 [Ferruginibacter sp.]|nr:hypothetical protein [Ferruginibacter sp.]
MLQSISWSQYITTITTLLMLYYCYVGFKYFRWEILNIIGIKKVEDDIIAIPAFSNTNQSFKKENPEDYLPKPGLEIDISPVVQSFTDEVQAYLSESGSKNMQKDELLGSLRFILSKYPALKSSDCKEELLQFIIEQTNFQYPDMLQLDEVSRLWH